MTTNYNDNVAVGSGDGTSTPRWVLIVRIIQAVLNILVLSLAAYAASYFYLDGYGMAFFTFVWTILFLLYIFLAPKVLPQLYLFWAHVAFEATVVIFWLVTFALLADYVRGFDYYWGRRGTGPVGATKAAMAFALFNWLLFSATLAVTVWFSRSHSSRTSTFADGPAHTHPRTNNHHTGTSTGGGGFSFSKLFGKRNGAADVEKTNAQNNGGAFDTAGQPVELHQHNNGAGAAGVNDGQYASPNPHVQAPNQSYQQPAQTGYDQSYQQPAQTGYEQGGYQQPR